MNPSMSGTMTIGHEPVDNALNPAWRETVVHLITSTAWSDSLPQKNVSQIVNDVTYNKLNALRGLDTDAGAYLNEVRCQNSKPTAHLSPHMPWFTELPVHRWTMHC